MNNKWDKWNLRFLMAIFLIILIFAYIFILLLVPSAKENETITGILLTGGFSTVLTFFYGSSDKKGKDVPEEGLGSKSLT